MRAEQEDQSRSAARQQDNRPSWGGQPSGISPLPASLPPLPADESSANWQRTTRDGYADGPDVGWHQSNLPALAQTSSLRPHTSLSAQILAIFAEPGLGYLSEEQINNLVTVSQQDLRVQLDALVRSGYLVRSPNEQTMYAVSSAYRGTLEQVFVETAHQLGEHSLVEYDPADSGGIEEDEPRLPITAGILSFFLPGTGQLLNGDIGRASLIFSVWALAMLLTPYHMIITFVRLYAGAEAFFNAKIRRIERRRRQEALTAARTNQRALRSSS